ncbi:S9 family peptidase [Bradyrhizobium sp. U87765 SZCCT0131]|uniref:S9 family peptidase n=1 Tax=unclassified Bradyrhizobium TaxID=2631580 RepID=UPI001BAA50F5|nr:MULTISPECIES: S9 family peptidase [unclassified Bradyrhizobium]MBR1219260.1 S9 family peptidase [Bradyrhizobium sp. U87765 SZCCT0131]MBR1261911.1 S9 family peptidase [Bradyrhizobium sp. U87765 SZCCT0134]MBR1306236.1 S9 family peptidase [Bradyrhizobium sp. U87765 SZCCT0110]MBR1317693.1 S9 family peptidase [Bradyrhizobium sp. U87765 SZCCT0109]MBR1351395.1 S9 family peptidase [Bradyrhizobium sp. U87765 SZCCT0048]
MPVLPIDRRRFLHHAALAGAALPLLSAWLAGRAQAAAELVPRSVFFDNPDVGSVSVSPDGWTVAWLAPVDGVRNLFVARIDDLKSARPVTRVTDRNLAPFYRWAQTNRHLVFFQERDGDENWRASSVNIHSGAIVPLTPPQGVRSFVQEIDRKFPTDMLMRHNQRDKRYFDLYRVNIVNGSSDLLYENTEYTGLITDGDFQLRLGVRFAKDGSAEVLERHATGSWSPFATIPVGDIDGTRLLDFSPDGHTLYFIDARGRDKAALFAMDMASRKTTLLASDDEADIVGVNWFNRRPVAAMSYRERARWHVVDTSMVQDLADLGASSGGGDIEILGRTYGNRIVTAYFEHDTASGEYALLDRETHEVRPLFKQRKALAGLPLQKLEPVVIPARDGLKLNGYLTRPADAPSGKAPMVLVIHGGPYARDAWGFNPTHQWLANRGYAVLSVNYRGSTGFGKAFVTAADREWGGRMHDDLIDAVDWAVAQGIADPARVGFYGASYGGYSALMAATKTPDKFACIVDLFGISNLKTFMATIPSYWGPWFSIWKQRLGDPATDEGRAFLTDRSPLTHIDRASKPILIAQGLKDVRVVAAESEQMVAALKARSVPVTYVSFSDEGHGFARPANRLAFYAVAEAFLGKHLGGRYEPVGDDFKGSTLKVETGGELVPGLAG